MPVPKLPDSAYPRQDYSGLKFTRLTAIRFLRLKRYTSVGSSSTKEIWLFRCDCGKEKAILLESVLKLKTKSCGCFRTDYLHRMFASEGRTSSITSKQSYHKHRAKRLTIGRTRYQQNKDIHRTLNKKNYERHRQKRILYQRQYSKSNKEKIRQRAILNRDYYRLKAAERCARIHKCEVDPSNIERWLAALKSKKFTKCYYCREKLPTDKIEIDHVIPIIKGGAHSSSNLAATCGRCNARKSRALPSEWFKPGQIFLSL